jgi:hypothetical protein
MITYSPPPLGAHRPRPYTGGGPNPYSRVHFVYIEILDLPGGPDCVHGGPNSLVKSQSISPPWTRGSTRPTHKTWTGTDIESEWLAEAGSSRSALETPSTE